MLFCLVVLQSSYSIDVVLAKVISSPVRYVSKLLTLLF
jgi:hypothetical protein